MKLSFVFILLLDIPHLKGQQRIEELQHIFLRLSFPQLYNSYIKCCCKLYPGGCYRLLDSAGYTCDLLRGRVTKVERDGWIEFQISNVQFVDAGYYRCSVLGAPNQIYTDYYVEVSEASHYHSQTQPPRTATIKTPNSSTILPDSTEPSLAQDHSDRSRSPWSFTVPLVAVVFIIMVIFITSGIAVVCCRSKARQKRSADIHGETLCESLKQEAPEMNGTVYTTVNFTPQQKPELVYANLQMHKIKAGARDTEHAGMVEYSTLAIQL